MFFNFKIDIINIIDTIFNWTFLTTNNQKVEKYEAQHVPKTWLAISIFQPTQNIRRNIFKQLGWS